MSLDQSIIAKFLHQAVIFLNGVPQIEFDCSISETHKREGTPTTFEVENGQTISDHIVMKPFNLKMQALISNSPLSSIAGLAGAAVATGIGAKAPNPGVLGPEAAAVAALGLIPDLFNPAGDAYSALLNLQSLRFPLTVLTSLHLYNNMWLTSIGAPRDAKTGGGLMVDLEFTQLLLVLPISVDIGKFAAADLAAGQANKGAQEAAHNEFVDAATKSFTDTVTAVGPE